MEIICAVDQEWNIGYCGAMLCNIPEDLKRFKMLTMGNIIIMGRRTFESLPKGQALPGRINIVLTRNQEYIADNILTAHSQEELFTLLQKINPSNLLINFVIGGGQIVRQLLPFCTKAHITKISKTFRKADTTIPNLDQDPNWKIQSKYPPLTENRLTYQYLTYQLAEKG